MKFFAIRHPWTEFNVKKITQGWADSSLTLEGRNMAKKLGDELINYHVSEIFSSDLGRCKQTAQIINEKLDVKVNYSSKLREQNLGKYNGKPKSDIAIEFDETDPEALPTGGESQNQAINRAFNFVANLPTDNCLIITHNGILQGLYSKALNLSLPCTECNTTPLTISEFGLGDHLRLLSAKDLSNA